ncbi:MAG: DEAD/DEAH box helicase [Bdellovibrionales bacterium]|nr:DEAD/DEAH box helicase [Bdellovibrionales bacterium]
MNIEHFSELALDERILTALEEAGYQKPTEIQAAAIPVALDGSDVMGSAQTGTGKTAAFVLPILQQLIAKESTEGEAPGDEGPEDGSSKEKNSKKGIRGLILSPTRELAQQIEESIAQYSKNLPMRVCSVVGGLPIQKQIRELSKGVDLLVATPGRLLDLMQRRVVSLRTIQFFVLDEADRMLDMGFVHDVNDIAKKLPKERQTFFFSATSSPDVESLARVLLRDPKRVAVHEIDTVGKNIESKVLFVDRRDKRDLIIELLKREEPKRTLIFTATKSDANVLAAIIGRQGISAASIHSDKSQKERQKALAAFDAGEVDVLVATDVMARGIDVQGITHVINYDIPQDAENFVHRIGRTARAGTSGIAMSLCDLDEVKYLQAIERFTKETLEVEREHSFHSPLVETMKGKKESPFARRGGGRRRFR